VSGATSCEDLSFLVSGSCFVGLAVEASSFGGSGIVLSWMGSALGTAVSREAGVLVSSVADVVSDFVAVAGVSSVFSSLAVGS
jgi:hypothetical protein